ncbi:MAG: thioredoxin-disulfide reductase [Tenericutes bacterium HGW-Tenericutes-4]|nr:MAG: thioredoxin-disulfide reductase [Tenericutes bacterium HGW-Tenericutes-4]
MYDVVIIGGGPAGMTAAIYALRAGMKTLLIEGASHGGQIVNTYEIKNYTGFEEINGVDLANKMHEQVNKLGADNVYDMVSELHLENEIKEIVTAYSGTFFAKAIILTMGAAARKLGIEREEELSGAGVSYCAICDGAFFKDKTVAVIGGGNTAIEDLIYLNKVAKKVYLIHRSERFRADKILLDAVDTIVNEPNSKTELVLNSGVTKLLGEIVLTGVEVTNILTNEVKTIKLDGLFVGIGRIPSTSIVKGILELDEYGYIKADEHMKTNIEGVYAAGDIRVKEVRQIITAASDGAIAATHASNYVGTKKWKE